VSIELLIFPKLSHKYVSFNSAHCLWVQYFARYIVDYLKTYAISFTLKSYPPAVGSNNYYTFLFGHPAYHILPENVRSGGCGTHPILRKSATFPVASAGGHTVARKSSRLLVGHSRLSHALSRLFTILPREEGK
jgi:hypothetical protein